MNANKKQAYKREKDVFIRIDKRFNTGDEKTKYQFKDLNGELYNIYITCRGRAYYIRPSKRGKLNKYYLPDELSNTILEELKSKKDKVLEKEGGIK